MKRRWRQLLEAAAPSVHAMALTGPGQRKDVGASQLQHSGGRHVADLWPLGHLRRGPLGLGSRKTNRRRLLRCRRAAWLGAFIDCGHEVRGFSVSTGRDLHAPPPAGGRLGALGVTGGA